MESSICAVVVIREPDVVVLKNLIDVIRQEVGAVLVVNNGNQITLDTELLENKTNVGVGAALNQGIGWARSRGFSSVIFFDQDSEPAIGMVAVLVGALAGLLLNGMNVGAVGPTLIDGRSGKYYRFARSRQPLSMRLSAVSGEEKICCDMLITSGCLIPLDVLSRVGSMEESLFVDNIDMEWCARARSMGYLLFGVPAAKMRHSIGDDVINLRIRRWSTTIRIHEPARLYYIVRNRILLYGMPHVKWGWKGNDLVRLTAKFIVSITIVPRRFENLAYMIRGMVDGVRGRRGPLR